MAHKGKLLEDCSLCKMDCLCYQCADDCNRCDNCGTDNYIGKCNNFRNKNECLPLKSKNGRIWNLLKFWE